MKFNEAWLREWVDPALSSQELGDRLTMAGLELDSITPAAEAFSKVIVGNITTVAAHPEADKLRLCQVDDGSGNTLQVVCGAPNVVEGMKAPFATTGAVLPGKVKIRKAKLRGQESNGMLCSARELGLGEDHDGIMALPPDAPVGAVLRDYLSLDDSIFEVDLTPNRGDCLGVAGVAREVASLTDCALNVPKIDPVPAVVDDTFPIELVDPQPCPRYAGRVIKGIDPHARTPLWMQERLRRCGVRSIAPVVDVTNYVMLELGQPMHAFDLGTLQGGIRVRFASEGESLELLDGQELKLDAQSLVIADHSRAVALAGIMGGLATGVTDSSRDIFLECAFFDPISIAGKAREYGLHTDASHRYERGVDPYLQIRAVERATALLLDIVGGKPGPVTETVEQQYIPGKQVISLKLGNIQRLLGVTVPPAEVEKMLVALGCEVNKGSDIFSVTPPSFRFDLNIEADLIEEVARLYGYNNIPASLPGNAPSITQQTNPRRHLSTLRQTLVDRAYQEAITFSFIEEEHDQWFNPDHVAKKLANPISAELAVMRGSLWPGLIGALKHNLNRQQSRLRLFETGLRFVNSGNHLQQLPTLAAVVTGPALPEQWGIAGQTVDFFDIKGDLEALLAVCGLENQVEFVAEAHPALHPGQSAAVKLNGENMGWVGALHPKLEKRFGLEQPVYLLELDLESLKQGEIAHFAALSRYPAIRRDISVVVDEAVTAEQIRACAREAGIPQLRELLLFDVYRGKGVSDGLKSCSLGLILQDLSRTLKDDEVDEFVARIVARMSNELGASLRI